MSDVRCTSCNNANEQLKRLNSKVLKGSQMFLCVDCIEAKREPRGYLILAAREHGVQFVQHWIKNRRYTGEEITLRELV